MYMPFVKTTDPKTRRQTVGLGGLDRRESTAAGTLWDSRGLSTDLWPSLSQRRGRTLERQAPGANSLYAWGELCYVEGNTLYYGGRAMGAVSPGEKRFAVVGGKLCIFPDKKYLDLDTRKMGDLQAAVVNPTGLEAVFTENAVTLEPDSLLGQIESGALMFQPTERWLRSLKNKSASGQSHYIQVFDQLDWDSETGQWLQSAADAREIWMPTAKQQSLIGKKVWLRDTGIAGGYALNFKRMDDYAYIDQRDRVSWNRVVKEDYGAYDTGGLYGVILAVTEKDRSGEYYYDYSAKDIILTVELHDASRANPSLEGLIFPGDRVNVSGCTNCPGNDRERLRVERVEGRTVTFAMPQDAPFTPAVETASVRLWREVPELDLICESGNRLFGVNNAQRTVYVSALGDPGNFYIYDGLPTDSARLTLGADGDVTGCVAYSGSVLFWQEDCLHKLMGSRPSAFEARTYHIAGLQRGSEKSMVIVNETLYYKSRDGVYAYSGSTPKLVSAPLGDAPYEEAVAGSDGRRYYISMKRTDTGAWELLTYDTRQGLWLREDDTRAVGFAQVEGRLHMLTETGLYALGQGEDDQGQSVAWEATFAPIYEDTLRRKRPARLLLRFELGQGAWVEAQLARDGGAFHTLWTLKATDGPTAVLPIRPGRCDSYRLRLKGEGRCILRSMEREFGLGGVK